MINIISYTGSLLMIVFSFTGCLPLAIAGLTLLSIQCWKLKAFNLVVINIFSIVGFLFQIIA